MRRSIRSTTGIRRRPCRRAVGQRDRQCRQRRLQAVGQIGDMAPRAFEIGGVLVEQPLSSATSGGSRSAARRARARCGRCAHRPPLGATAPADAGRASPAARSQAPAPRRARQAKCRASSSPRATAPAPRRAAPSDDHDRRAPRRSRAGSGNAAGSSSGPDPSAGRGRFSVGGRSTRPAAAEAVAASIDVLTGEAYRARRRPASASAARSFGPVTCQYQPRAAGRTADRRHCRQAIIVPSPSARSIDDRNAICVSSRWSIWPCTKRCSTKPIDDGGDDQRHRDERRRPPAAAAGSARRRATSASACRQAIAATAHGFDQVVADLAAQPRDDHLERIGIACRHRPRRPSPSVRCDRRRHPCAGSGIPARAIPAPSASAAGRRVRTRRSARRTSAGRRRCSGAAWPAERRTSARSRMISSSTRNGLVR